MVPLMLFIGALDTKKQELTGIEVMVGLGEKSQLYIRSVQQQLEDGLIKDEKNQS
ncbi:hypothetical protein EV03_0130 [Prochlorococcus marinus str. PAC1]|uniref:Uncharacterized protein n=2 Tax=Prochlorococcus marinus TaxID=1219 RepID=A0A0A2CD21_PROMR|nr:hypothetical protein EV03_0130 [Prochlorococcus marinus str. PAC1]